MEREVTMAGQRAVACDIEGKGKAGAPGRGERKQAQRAAVERSRGCDGKRRGRGKWDKMRLVGCNVSAKNAREFSRWVR